MATEDRKWWVLAAMSCVLGLVVLDETVVGVALPSIRSDIALTQGTSHWVVNAYLLIFTCFVAVGGKLADRFGHGSTFLAGLAVFGVASLASGFARDGGALVAARAMQGAGAAVIFPASWAMMTHTFPPEQRGLAFGIQTTVAGVFMSLGPLVGGFLAEDVSWRWIFWINLPVVVAIAVILSAVSRPVPSETRPAMSGRHGSFDLLGLVTLIAGLPAVVTGLMEGARWGWESPATLLLLCAGLLLLGLFTATELRRQRPLIAVRLFRIATFTGGNVVFFMFQYSKVAVFVFVPLYLQHARGESPIDAGIVVTLAILPALLSSLLGGRLADRLGSRRPLLVGLSLNTVAVGLVAAAMAYGGSGVILGPLLLWGATLPLLAVPARRALMGAVPADQNGQASGVNLTVQMLGGTVGMALCGALLVATGAYWPLFLTLSTLTFLAAVGSWLTVERPAIPVVVPVD